MAADHAMRLLLALALAVLAAPALAQPPATFAAAKALLPGIHEEIGRLRIRYCGCPYRWLMRMLWCSSRRCCSCSASRCFWSSRHCSSALRLRSSSSFHSGREQPLPASIAKLSWADP